MLLIQSDSNGIPINGDCYCALDGAIQEDIPYQLVSIDNLNSTITEKYTPVGSIEFLKASFCYFGLDIPKLPFNSNRAHLNVSLEEALEIGREKKIFIKPEETKLFTGFVYEGYTYSCLEGIPLDTPVLVYEVFSSFIETEWRAYIYRNKVIDIRNYSGDFFLMPNREYIEELVDTNRKLEFPIAYSIDVGVLEDKTHVVIEYNDFWALGNYGMPNWLYVKCLIARYRQIINSAVFTYVGR